MNSILVYFLPSIIGIKIYEVLTKNKNNKDLIFNYLTLVGTTSLGYILEDNSYKNYLLLGSDASFGCREDYFTYYGNYETYDLYYARNNKWIDKDYYEWWDFEDRKLFSFAKKKKLSTISKNNEPFNFTILTADTHFYDGYQDKKCKKEFDSDYANSYYCLDEILNNFIKWLQKQDFYKILQ